MLCETHGRRLNNTTARISVLRMKLPTGENHSVLYLDTHLTQPIYLSTILREWKVFSTVPISRTILGFTDRVQDRASHTVGI